MYHYGADLNDSHKLALSWANIRFFKAARARL